MEGNTNRKDGVKFETELCQKLAEAGWWAHDMTQSAAGQPADVIAVRANCAVLIDCKVCSKDEFPLSRIEPNQDSAMSLWRDRGNRYAYFALRSQNGVIYMLDYLTAKDMMRAGTKAVPLWYMVMYLPKLDEWLYQMEDEI